MIHHDANTRKINTQGSSNHKDPLHSLRASTRLLGPSNASGSPLPLPSPRLEEPAAIRKSMASRRAPHNTEQLRVHPHNQCSTQATCNRIQTCRDSRIAHNITSMAVPVLYMEWASQVSRRHNRHMIRFHGTLSDLVPRLRHWRPNLEFRSNTTLLQQVRLRRRWRRTCRRSISIPQHTCQLELRHRKHTVVP